MGIARQAKDEIYLCPPILVLTGRPQDAWLATWSRAEAALDAARLDRWTVVDMKKDWKRIFAFDR